MCDSFHKMTHCDKKVHTAWSVAHLLLANWLHHTSSPSHICNIVYKFILFICFQVKILLFQSAHPTPATQLWILELTCIKFSAFWTICSLKMEHLSLQKPCNNGLIVKVFDGLPHSLPFTGMWYCWALEWPPQKETQNDFRLSLSPPPAPYMLFSKAF